MGVRVFGVSHFDGTLAERRLCVLAVVVFPLPTFLVTSSSC